MYVANNAHFYCEKCSKDAHVLDWIIEGCPNHYQDTVLRFVGDKKAVNSADRLTIYVTIAGHFSTKAGLPWLQGFLENLNKQH